MGQARDQSASDCKYESCKNFPSRSRDRRREEGRKRSRNRDGTVALAAVLLLLVVTVVAFGAVNRRVEAHRLKVFKLIARDQMAQLGPHLAAEVSRVPAPCPTCAWR